MEDWIRGSGDPQARLRKRLEDDTSFSDSSLYDSMYIGASALQIMRGVAKTRDISAVMAKMIAEIEMEIRACTTQLLGHSDPGSQEARQLHFKARVAAGILSMLNRYIVDGQKAADKINRTDPDTDPEN
jgi:hypothetical protein